MESDPSSVISLLDRKIAETREGMHKLCAHPGVVDYLARKLTMFEALRSRASENIQNA